MAEILRYVLVDRDDNEGEHEYLTERDAIEAAGKDHAVVMRTYLYDDSELVWTPNGDQFWPPSFGQPIAPKGKARG